MTSRIEIPATYVNNQLIDADHMNTYVRTNLSSIDSGYGCRVEETTSQNITQNTWTALTFGNETFDDDTMHDNSTNPSRITIKSAGRYLITGSVLFTGTSGNNWRQSAIYVNGSLVSYGSTVSALNAGNSETVQISDVYPLAENDYVEFFVYNSSTSSFTAGNRRFSVTKYV